MSGKATAIPIIGAKLDADVADANATSQQPTVEKFHSIFWRCVLPSLRRLTITGILAGTLSCALIARWGTPAARTLAGGLAIVAVATLVVVHIRRLLQRNHIERVLTQIVQPVDGVAARRALRAVRLVRQTQVSAHAGSSALAQIHLNRTLLALSENAVRVHARRRAWLLDALTSVAMLTAVSIAVTSGHRVLEGLDVEFARGGHAPVPMFWLDIQGVTAQPPPYLRIGEHALQFGSRVAEPVGTVISVRGTKVHADTELFLSNGSRTVQFAETTDDEAIAQFTVEHAERLQVTARFGQVFIDQFDSIIVDAEPDEVPQVTLEQGGHVVRLDQTPQIILNYRAWDDHGLRQIDLVLRSPDREERRTIVRLDGQQLEHEGTHALSNNDVFLRTARLTSQVRIEARDDNNLGPSAWGVSDWVTLEPPMPGQSEADRLAAMRLIRSQLVDWLEAQITTQRTSRDSREIARLRQQALDTLESSVTRAADTWQWPAAVEVLLRGVREKLAKSPNHTADHDELLGDAVLVLDAAIQELSFRDARSVAGTLAAVADDVVRGARQASGGELRSAGTRRVSGAITLLRGATRPLGTLGVLGADLAAVVAATVTRMGRANDALDFTHLQWAAEHLAARLRRPEPSAGSRETSGVEAASNSVMSRQLMSHSASAAAMRLERLLMELQQLKQEHQAEVELLEHALKQAESEMNSEQPLEESREHAQRLRHAAETVPYLGAEPDSALSSQGVAREQALSAADAIRRAQNDDALKRIRVARDAINEAFLRAKREHKPPNIDEKPLSKLDAELSNQTEYLEQQLQHLRQKIAGATGDKLHGQMPVERQLAGRARAIAQREQQKGAWMPEAARGELMRASESMDFASDELGKNNGPQALEHARYAQALLERFDAQAQDRNVGNGHDELLRANRSLPSQGTVTPTGDPETAVRFRARVQRGLSSSGHGELDSAVRRYAEGLLR